MKEADGFISRRGRPRVAKISRRRLALDDILARDAKR